VQDLFISIIVPLEETTTDLQSYLTEVHATISTHFSHFEIIVVDDAATYGGINHAVSASLNNLDGVRYVRLVRTYGFEVATRCGMDIAIGDIIAVLTPGIDPPDLLPELSKRVLEENRVMIGKPSGVTVSHSTAQLSKVRDLLIHSLFEAEIPEQTSNFIVLNRTTLNALLAFKDRGGYLKASLSILGFALTTFNYTPRKESARGQVFRRIGRYLDLIFANSNKPLRWGALLAVAVSGGNLVYVGYIVLIALFKKDVAEGWITLSLQSAVNFFVFSLTLAIAFEYLWKTLLESRNRPSYFIAEEKTSSRMIYKDDEIRNIVKESVTH
jgi:glycosyltransferase involved in cell wall biosynthesis